MSTSSHPMAAKLRQIAEDKTHAASSSWLHAAAIAIDMLHAEKLEGVKNGTRQLTAADHAFIERASILALVEKAKRPYPAANGYEYGWNDACDHISRSIVE